MRRRRWQGVLGLWANLVAAARLRVLADPATGAETNIVADLAALAARLPGALGVVGAFVADLDLIVACLIRNTGATRHPRLVATNARRLRARRLSRVMHDDRHRGRRRQLLRALFARDQNAQDPRSHSSTLTLRGMCCEQFTSHAVTVRRQTCSVLRGIGRPGGASATGTMRAVPQTFTRCCVA